MSTSAKTEASNAFRTPIPHANLALDRYEYAVTRLAAMREHLPSRRVFDVGPGDGRLRSPVQQLGLEWLGFDREPWADVSGWDINQPGVPDCARAGAVLLLDVIEHCPNPGLALQNIAAAILPGGRLIVTTPNPSWSASRIHYFIRGQSSGFTPRDLAENHHLFPVWPHSLTRLLNYAGFELEEYVSLDGWTTLSRRDGRLGGVTRLGLNIVQGIMERIDATAKGMSYAIVARRF